MSAIPYGKVDMEEYGNFTDIEKNILSALKEGKELSAKDMITMGIKGYGYIAAFLNKCDYADILLYEGYDEKKKRVIWGDGGEGHGAESGR
jgi:hypothetical protein